MRSTYSLFLCVLATCLVAITDAVPLVPFQAPTTLMARSAWKREVVPKDFVTLPYGPEGAAYPTSSLTFAAHPNVPILVLENLEFLIEEVMCRPAKEGEGDVVEVFFISQDAYAATLAAWSSLSQFMLVTSHPTCNPHDQRGAWLVSAVAGEESTSGIVLLVKTLPLRELGSSFHLSHSAGSVTSAWGSRGTTKSLGARDIDHVFPLDKSFDFAPRQQLFPIDPSLGDNESILSTLENAIEDVLGLDDKDADPLGLQVFCVDCVSVSNFSVGIEVNVTDLLNVQKAYVNITLDDFEHDIKLEFSLNDTASYQKTLDVIALAIPDLGLGIPDVIDIGFFFGAALRMDVELSGELNFTVGASTSITPGASATFMMSQFNQSSAVGWDKVNFDIHPFRLNSGSFNASAALSLSPFVEATLKLGAGLFDATARLYVNTPHVMGAARVASNVTRACEPLGPNDFEFFDIGLSFGAGLNLTLDATATGSFFADKDDALFSKALDFGDLPPLASPACMIIADDDAAATATASLAGQVVAPTGTLLLAETAIPSFNVAGIQSYYSANGHLPTGVNYEQMLKATTVPDDIKKAVQKAGALELHATLSLASVAAAVAVGGAMVLVL
ncbi:hypothetical protein B0H19DRAFT_1232686 [Mycena capillaripes]|nr:hypothetical protein B0H19DRAFT_1232686 [Mycena capillaripes]